MAIFSRKRYINEIFRAKAYNNNTLLLEAICTDAHIFEKTMKIELSPIPQAYTLNL
jgi:hypothetical protein